MDLDQTWPEDAQTCYLSKLQLGSVNLSVCGRRNCMISVFWWAINAITELQLLLLLNHRTNCLAFCANLSHLNHSKMPERIFLELFWGPPKWQGKTPKRQNRLESVAFGALPPMICGVTHWEPLESEYFLIYGEFSRIYWPPWASGHGSHPWGLPVQLGRAD